MMPGKREWDVQVLRSCFFQHDVTEVEKNRLSEGIPDDVIAWHYERSRLFTVRSAYDLTVKLEKENDMNTESSSMVNGERPLYRNIWEAQVPAKVRVFGWRLSQEG
jgi:hypothetical protein